MPTLTKKAREETCEEKETQGQLGLCETCKHRGHCIFLKVQEGPVLQCNEFKEEEVPQEKTHSERASKREYEKDSKYKGLCKNCQKRETCTLPQPESGVWFCEEYC